MKILSLAVFIAAGLCSAGLMAEDRPSRWDNFYVEGTAGAGRSAALGGLSLFGPLYSSEEGFLYTDLRGIWGDNLDAVQSYGFGGRFQDYHDLIRGVYAFYDRHQSSSDTTHQQLTIGAELLSVGWDFRINAYLPNKSFSQSHTFGDLHEGRVVVRGLTEASYYGADTEFGYLLDEWRDGQIELRGYIGGYWFDRNYDGFDAFVGPRARAELRLFDLDWLGPGSRLVAAGQADWNRRDKTQLTALLTLRVPLQLRKSKPLSRLDRRMLNPIARWPGVFLNTLWTVEPAAFSDGRAISETLTINADTPDPETAVNQLPPNSLVIIDGSEGAIELNSTLRMPEGQTLVGGEGFFEVIGRTTGGRGPFVAPGTRPDVVQIDPFATAIQLPTRNGYVLGLNVFSIDHAIVGTSTVNTGIAGNLIAGRALTSSTGHGVWLDGDQRNLRIHSNIIAGKVNGVRVDGDFQGELFENVVTTNEASGIHVNDDLHADVTNNLLLSNGNRGLIVGGNLVGDVQQNAFADNDKDGLLVMGSTTGRIVENEALENRGTGFRLDEDVRGDITDNVSSRNRIAGFSVGGILDGNFEGNVAERNDRYGFTLGSRVNGDIADNVLSQNGVAGLFAIGGVQNVTGNQFIENGRRGSTTGSKAGMHLMGRVEGSIADNEFRGNTGYGVSLLVDDPQTITFVRNEMSDNNHGGGELLLMPNDGSASDLIMILRDNTSESGGSAFPYATYQRMDGARFIDDGGNTGRIE